MHVHVTMFVHHNQTGLLNATLCHYDDVQVHVCNNASVCTSVSQHERRHVPALCVNCKEITTRNNCNQVGEAEIRREFSKDYGKLDWKAIYTTRRS